MRYINVLFDLDGTLIRSEDGIINSVEYALQQLNAPCPKRDFLKRFIGPPLIESFEGLCGLSTENAQQAVDLYRQRYSKTGLFECALYPGVPQMLQDLTNAGCRIHLATGKPEVYARRILEHLHMLPLFSSVVGIPLDVNHHGKASIIRRVLAENAALPSTAVMVGDRHHDIDGATACALNSIGVLYGYGTQQELTEAGATFLARTAAEVTPLVLS